MTSFHQVFDPQKYRTSKGKDPVDAEGNLVCIGDTIELLADYHYNKGEQAIVRCYTIEVYDFGVEFSHNNPGHNLDGLLHNSAGLYVASQQIKLIKKEVSVDEETHIKNLIEEASKEPKLALIEGKFFTLNLVPKATADEFASSLMRSVSSRIAKIRAEATAKVAQAEAKLIQQLVMPEITMNDLKKGMSVYNNGSYIAYIVPLHYAPKFVDENKRGHPTAELCDEHKKLLEQDVLLVVHVTKEGRIAQVGTHKSDFSTFQHYHGNETQCLGSVTPPTIKSPTDIFVFRDRLQKALELINLGSLYDSRPGDMPTDEQLTDKLVLLKATWSEAPDIKVGSMVKILAEHDSSKDLTGLIGKVNCQYMTWVSVEFIVSKPFMHAGHDGKGKKGYCYDFPESKLQVMPPGTRRTRRAASPTTTTWVDEEEEAETILPTFDSTEDEQFAKFGIRGDNGDMNIICRRCGEMWGNHYGTHPGVCICPDEFRAGRRAENLNVHVERAWASRPFELEAVPA